MRLEVGITDLSSREAEVARVGRGEGGGGGRVRDERSFPSTAQVGLLYTL
jgi:hypothetical protein